MSEQTNLDGHLVNVDTLLDTELWHENIKRSIQDTDDLGLTNNRTVALGEVVDQDAQEQMSGLLLRELRGVLLTGEQPRVSMKKTYIKDERTCCTAARPSQQRRDP